jgi:mono/diheme cytochrome c family protein
MKYALTVLATLTALGLLALAFPYTGLYNVSAAEGHTPLVRWYLSTTSANSIDARADAIDVPPDLSDSTRIVRAAATFDAMCVTCHGGPGVERGEIGEGMTPEPPELDHAAEEWTPEEIYWVLREGIKMAGMPAFGPTHSEETLWDLTAFVERLPAMSPERYQMLIAASPGHHDGSEHGHGEEEVATDTTSSSTDDGHTHSEGEEHAP